MSSLLAGLYAITDSQLSPANCLLNHTEQAIRGGAKIIQYRDKSDNQRQRLEQAMALRTLCHRHQVPLIINDDIELALAVDTDGVHLGKNDGDIASARQKLGHRLIGVSCYNDWPSAEAAQAAGADYVAFGAFFPSSTKPNAPRATTDLLKQAKQKLSIPSVAIGGITPANGRALVQSGADMLAVIHGIFGQTNIHRAAQQYSELFDLD